MFSPLKLKANEKTIKYLLGQLLVVHKQKKACKAKEFIYVYHSKGCFPIDWTDRVSEMSQLMLLGIGINVLDHIVVQEAVEDINEANVTFKKTLEPTLNPSDPSFSNWWNKNKHKWARDFKKEREDALNNRKMIQLGSYPTEKNGQLAPLKWRVLEEISDKKLVVCNQGIELHHFINIHDNAVWKDNSIRQWLNGDFIQTAFSNEERNIICSVENQVYDLVETVTTTGKLWNKKTTSTWNKVIQTTTDQVFLLGFEETFRKYYLNEQERQLALTPYVLEKLSKNNLKQEDAYWVQMGSRPYPEQMSGYNVQTGIRKELNLNTDKWGIIRPAMWIKK